MGWLIALLTWGLPLVIMPWVDDPWNEPKEVLWLLGCWGIIVLGLFHNRVSLGLWRNRWIGRFVFWILLLGIARFYWPYLTRPHGATRIAYAVHHWIPTVYVCTAVLAVRVLAAWLSIPTHLAWLTRWVCLSTLVIAVYAVLQGCGIDEFYRANYTVASPSRMAGVAFGNAGTTAMYLAVLLPLFFLLQGWRWVIAGGFVLAVIAWLPYRSSWIVAASGLATYGICRLWVQVWMNRSRKLLLSAVLLITLLCSSLVIGKSFSTDERWPVWKETVYQWNNSKHPWTGQGLQAFPDKFVNGFKTLRPSSRALIGPIQWPTPMNEWVQALYETGLVGISLLCLVAISVLWQGVRLANTAVGAGWFACGISMLMCSTVFFPWHYAPMAWLTMLVVSVIERNPQGGFG